MHTHTQIHFDILDNHLLLIIIYLFIYLLFSHLADTFIQSDLQMRTTEAINWSIKTTKNRSRTKS